MIIELPQLGLYAPSLDQMLRILQELVQNDPSKYVVEQKYFNTDALYKDALAYSKAEDLVNSNELFDLVCDRVCSTAFSELFHQALSVTKKSA